MSEKKNEGLIKKINTPAKDNPDNQMKKADKELKESSGIIIENKQEDTINRTSVNLVTPKDTIPNSVANTSETLKDNVVSKNMENKNQHINTPITQIIENDTLRNEEINPVINKKKKRRRKLSKEEAEILPSMGPDKIIIPSGTPTEENVKLREE
jgi:hypothetical protein